MESKTIEERANEFCENMGGDLRYKTYYLVIATEQDRIARQEERERCIKAALKTTCECCMSHSFGCRANENCQKLVGIRKAMEGGEE